MNVNVFFSVFFSLHSQDVLFYGPLDKCPICGCTLEYNGRNYSCKGEYSEWSSCTYTTTDPPRRRDGRLKIPESVRNSPVSDVMSKHVLYVTA